MRHPWGVESTPEPDRSLAPSSQPPLLRRQDTRLDSYVDRYAARTHGMTASAIRALFAVANRPEVVSLAGGMPNIADLPLDVVGSTLHDLVLSRGLQAMQYGSGQGEPEIREAICEVMRLEGISAHPDDVTVTVGSQQALDLVTRIFCDPGDVVLCEAPSYVGALGVFRSFQCEVAHVAMDEQGLVPEALREAVLALRAAGRSVKFVYTIPSFHNPAGVTQSLERREAILAVAEETDLLVIEDNPYGLLGFDADPIPAIRSLSDDRVVYLGHVLQDLRAGLPDRLGPRAARRAGEAGARPGVGDALPADLQPVRDHRLPAPARLAGPDQGLRRDVPGAARRHARRARRRHARRRHLDGPGRRLLRVGHAAARASTRRRCCPAPSPRAWRTCRARPSTPTASAAGTCGCPTASPPLSASSRAPAASARSSRTRRS